MAGCRILGDHGASAGSLVGGVRVPKTLELLPTLWQMKPDPGVTAGLLAGRAGSQSLAVGPRDPRAYFRLLRGQGEGERQFWTQLGVGYGAQGIPKVAFSC